MLEAVFGEWHEFVSIVVGTFLAEQLAWALFNAFYLYLDDHNIFSQYKLQKGRTQAPAVRWGTFRTLAYSHLTQPVMLVLAYPLLRYCGFSSTIPFPNWQEFLVQFLIINIFEDTGFYWVHRWMHTPYAFKKFHHVHHKYVAPFSLVGEVAHPVEFVFNFLLPLMSGPLLIGYFRGLHIVTFWAWLVFRVIRSTDAHSGYNLPYHPLRLIQFMYGGPVYHDLHHMVKGQPSCNFGGYRIWDWLCNTERSPDTVPVVK